jgi:zinc protease
VGPISVQFEAQPDKADQCITAIIAELPKMKDAAYLSDDEIKNAVFHAEMDDMHAREKPSELAHTLSFWWTSAGLDYYTGYVPNLKKATRADIAKYLDRYMIGKPFVLAVMASPEMAKAGLDQTHFEKLVGVTK